MVRASFLSLLLLFSLPAEAAWKTVDCSTHPVELVGGGFSKAASQCEKWQRGTTESFRLIQSTDADQYLIVISNRGLLNTHWKALAKDDMKRVLKNINPWTKTYGHTWSTPKDLLGGKSIQVLGKDDSREGVCIDYSAQSEPRHPGYAKQLHIVYCEPGSAFLSNDRISEIIGWIRLSKN